MNDICGTICIAARFVTFIFIAVVVFCDRKEKIASLTVFIKSSVS